LAVFAVALVPVLIPGMLHRPGGNVTFTLGTVFWAALLVIAAVSWWIISQLMVPVMYRQRCTAWSALEKVLALITSQPAELILFILLYVAVSIVLALLVLIAGIMTCCIGLCLFS